MKKILLFLIVFLYTSNVLSAEVYTVDSASVRVNNEDMKECTNLYVWQPWQKVDGILKIDEKNNTIELSFTNKTIYTIDTKNFFSNKNSDIVVTSYLIGNSSILSVSKIFNSYFFYINDIVNKIEVYYKINKVDV